MLKTIVFVFVFGLSVAASFAACPGTNGANGVGTTGASGGNGLPGDPGCAGGNGGNGAPNTAGAGKINDNDA